MSGVRLSPDGRWLLRPGEGGVVIRDLLTTEVRSVPGYRFTPGAWSDDGRWLVLDNDQSGPDLLDLTTGQRQPIRFDQSHTGWRVDAVLGPHEVLLQQVYDYDRRDPDPRHEMYVTSDPASGAVLREYPVDFGAGGVGATAGGRLILGTTLTTAKDPGQVIVADLYRGAPLARWPFPAEYPAGYGFWTAGRLGGDTIVLVRDYDFGGEPPRSDPVQLFTLDVTTGERRLVCTLPPRTQLILAH
jgi:hypothetical protein